MSTMTHDMLSIGDFAIDDHSYVLVNIEDPWISSFDEQLGEHEFLCSQYNSISAFYSHDGST